MVLPGSRCSLLKTQRRLVDYKAQDFALGFDFE